MATARRLADSSRSDAEIAEMRAIAEASGFTHISELVTAELARLEGDIEAPA